MTLTSTTSQQGDRQLDKNGSVMFHDPMAASRGSGSTEVIIVCANESRQLASPVERQAGAKESLAAVIDVSERDGVEAACHTLELDIVRQNRFRSRGRVAILERKCLETAASEPIAM